MESMLDSIGFRRPESIKGFAMYPPFIPAACPGHLP